MYSYFLRANLLFFSSLTAIMILAGICSSTELIHQFYGIINPQSIVPTPTATIDNLVIHDLRPIERHYHPSLDRALFSFSFHTDLRPIWHWNVKQIFLWIRADFNYTDSKQKSIDSNLLRYNNRATIYDMIIQSREASLVNIPQLRPEYPLADFAKSLRGATVKLTVHYEIMPSVGLLHEHQVPIAASNGTIIGAYTFKLPNKYS